VLHAPLGEIKSPATAGTREAAHLPPFGHLPHTLQHVRMAAWLTQHPAAAGTRRHDRRRRRDRAALGACEAIGLLQEVVEPAPAPVTPPAFVAQPAPEPESEPEPIAEEAPIVPAAEEVAGAEGIEEVSVLPVAQPVETMSVLERLRASREQNRARVAAIRAASST
jgi:hypothetical protein